MIDLEDIENRRANLVSWGVTNGTNLHAAEFLTVDVPALIAEVRRLRNVSKK